MSDWIMQNSFFPGGCQIDYYDPVTGQALPPQIYQLPNVYQPPHLYQQPAASEQLGIPFFPSYSPAVGIQEPEAAFHLANNFQQQPVPVQDMMPLHLRGSPPPYDAPGFVHELDSADEELDSEEDFDSVDEDMDSDSDEEGDHAENIFHYEVFQHEVYQQPVVPVAPIAPVMPIMPVMPMMPIEYIEPLEYIEPIIHNIPAMPVEYITPLEPLKYIMPTIPAIRAAPTLQAPHHILEQNIQEEPVARRLHVQPKKNLPRASTAAKSRAWKALLRRWEISHMQRRMAVRRTAGCGLRLQHKDKKLDKKLDKKINKKPRRRSIDLMIVVEE